MKQFLAKHKNALLVASIDLLTGVPLWINTVYVKTTAPPRSPARSAPKEQRLAMTRNRHGIAAFLALSLFLAAVSLGQAEEAQIITVPSYAVLLTDDVGHKAPAREFNCLRRVYVYFTWYKLSGLHQVTALWFNPMGRQQDQADLKFVADKPRVENWMALEFRNIFNEKYPLVPDLSTAKLIGKWEVKILLDGNYLETLTFNVNCG